MHGWVEPQTRKSARGQNSTHTTKYIIYFILYVREDVIYSESTALHYTALHCTALYTRTGNHNMLSIAFGIDNWFTMRETRGGWITWLLLVIVIVIEEISFMQFPVYDAAHL